MTASGFAALAALLALGVWGFSAPAAQDEPPADKSANPIVVIETSMGTVEVEIDSAKAPITAENFLTYVDAKFYDGTVFHRVIPDFMVQCGGFDETFYTGRPKEKATRAAIKNEGGNGLKNTRGTLAMARTGDPDSATAQFFVNVADNGFLDRAQARDGHGYAVFGKVVSGMDVIDKIVAARTSTKGPHENVPVEVITIKSARRKK